MFIGIYGNERRISVDSVILGLEAILDLDPVFGYRNPRFWRANEMESFEAVVVDAGTKNFEEIAKAYQKRNSKVYKAIVLSDNVSIHPWGNGKKEGQKAVEAPVVSKNLDWKFENGAWGGKPAVIIGGGPSLRNFDWNRIAGYHSIGINRAHEFVDVDIVFWVDVRFYKWTREGDYGAEAKKRFNSSHHKKVALLQTACRYPAHVIPIRPFRRGDSLSGSLEDGLVRMSNGGVSALNLAILLGADPIYLLGFDCVSVKGKDQEHFHSGHPQTQPSGVYTKFIRDFERIADQASSRARVINCNPDSEIRCFEFGSLPEINAPAIKKSKTRPQIEIPKPKESPQAMVVESAVAESEGEKEAVQLNAADYPLFVSAYTRDYYMDAIRLRESLEKYGLDCEFYELEESGNWAENCAKKSGVIRKARLQNNRRPIVWIDADAEVKKPPLLFGELVKQKIDFAAFTLEAKNKAPELLSGTLFFGESEAAGRLLGLWYREQKRNSKEWDQRVLQRVLAGMKFPLERAALPAEYCRIFDHREMKNVDPVIEHFQASRIRKNKRKVNAK